jgi:hypothetical protein
MTSVGVNFKSVVSRAKSAKFRRLAGRRSDCWECNRQMSVTCGPPGGRAADPRIYRQTVGELSLSKTEERGRKEQGRSDGVGAATPPASFIRVSVVVRATCLPPERHLTAIHDAPSGDSAGVPPSGGRILCQLRCWPHGSSDKADSRYDPKDTRVY